MVVSHYVVSWIQAGGLIVGLYGFFFLSIGVFGDHTMPWFVNMLPSSALALGLFVLLRLSSNLPGTTIVAWVAPVATMACFVLCYARLMRSARRRNARERYYARLPDEEAELRRVVEARKRRNPYQFTTQNALGFALFVLGAAGYGWGLAFGSSGTSDAGAILMAAALILGVALQGESLARVLNREGLQKLGFVLSASAILTQFIPPVLDLLNITVK